MAGFDHNLDDIAGFDGDVAGKVCELGDGGDAIGLVADVDEDFGGGDFQDLAFEDFIPGRRGEMAVIFEEVFVLVRIYRIELWI